MREHEELAKLALALIEGMLHDAPQVDELLLDAFDSLAEAATAHAYLSGFLVQLLAAHRRESVDATLGEVRRLLDLT